MIAPTIQTHNHNTWLLRLPFPWSSCKIPPPTPYPNLIQPPDPWLLANVEKSTFVVVQNYKASLSLHLTT